MLDLGRLLGSQGDTSTPQKFSIYLPDRDGKNGPIQTIGSWIDQAVVLMTEINGGCTKLPPAKGAWINSTTGSYVVEDTVVIYSYLLRPELFEQRFEELVEFLHTFGRETQQDAVMAEFSGWVDGEGYVNEAFFIPSASFADPSL